MLGLFSYMLCKLNIYLFRAHARFVSNQTSMLTFLFICDFWTTIYIYIYIYKSSNNTIKHFQEAWSISFSRNRRTRMLEICHYHYRISSPPSEELRKGKMSKDQRLARCRANPMLPFVSFYYMQSNNGK